MPFKLQLYENLRDVGLFLSKRMLTGGVWTVKVGQCNGWRIGLCLVHKWVAELCKRPRQRLLHAAVGTQNNWRCTTEMPLL